MGDNVGVGRGRVCACLGVNGNQVPGADAVGKEEGRWGGEVLPVGWGLPASEMQSSSRLRLCSHCLTVMRSQGCLQASESDRERRDREGEGRANECTGSVQHGWEKESV